MVVGIKILLNAGFLRLGQLNAFTHIPVIFFSIANTVGLKKIKNTKQLSLHMRTGFKYLKTNHNDIVQPCLLTRDS